MFRSYSRTYERAWAKKVDTVDDWGLTVHEDAGAVFRDTLAEQYVVIAESSALKDRFFEVLNEGYPKILRIHATTSLSFTVVAYMFEGFPKSKVNPQTIAYWMKNDTSKHQKVSNKKRTNIKMH